jgi:membrane protein implicated in regulation of membrane protease activity
VRSGRDLLLANLAALALILVAALLGWWDAAAFGLAVLAVLDLLVFLRERQVRHTPPPQPDASLPDELPDTGPAEEKERE